MNLDHRVSDLQIYLSEAKPVVVDEAEGYSVTKHTFTARYLTGFSLWWSLWVWRLRSASEPVRPVLDEFHNGYELHTVLHKHNTGSESDNIRSISESTSAELGFWGFVMFYIMFISAWDWRVLHSAHCTLYIIMFSVYFGVELKTWSPEDLQKTEGLTSLMRIKPFRIHIW